MHPAAPGKLVGDKSRISVRHAGNEIDDNQICLIGCILFL